MKSNTSLTSAVNVINNLRPLFLTYLIHRIYDPKSVSSLLATGEVSLPYRNDRMISEGSCTHLSHRDSSTNSAMTEIIFSKEPTRYLSSGRMVTTSSSSSSSPSSSSSVAESFCTSTGYNKYE